MKRGLWILKGIVFVALMVTIFGLATMLLWNWLVPVLFAGPVITFWQAIGLLLLIKILFWSVGKGHHHKGDHPWKSYWKRRWDNMTPEDRDRLKKRMMDKWCSPPKATEKENPVAND